ncbi:ATP-dependent DNA helicase RecG [Alicyclobacillus tolerans]|uniref:ATP-dependent DNA helicase RecG n=1 Tax=Alicyclobacillus tolerans TaxID=90970 RepID=UPI003B7F3772
MLEKVPVTHVAGIGPAKTKALAELGIHDVAALLTHFPYRYDDLRIRPLLSYADGDRVRVQVTINGSPKLRWQNGKSILQAPVLVDFQTPAYAMWFNQHYLQKRLREGEVVILQGKWSERYRRIAVSHTEFGNQRLRSEEAAMYPVYRSSKQISSPQIAAFIQQALAQFQDQIVDLLPLELRQRYKLVNRYEALLAMHRPRTREELRQAHRRLAFEEFFLFQLQLQRYRVQAKLQSDGVVRHVPSDVFEKFADALEGFTLTDGQYDAMQEIYHDLNSPRAMTRLLQGDVGSGKTWVAFFAAYAMVRAGWQVAMMAPTEILAEQHLLEARKRLEPLGVRVALLTGSTGIRERREILALLAAHQVDLLLGTHALLTGDVEFARLGLVITDEQHRFGVAQRGTLQEKGERTDILYLSATPIPRTLALAIYGDLDVSVIRERPKGRQPVRTFWLRSSEEDKAVRMVRRELAKGRQAYIVAPLVEDSEKLEATSAVSLYEQMQSHLAGYRVSMLHGRQSAKEKDAIMRSFIAGEIQALVSTTVIEVGIDVPNATIMLIYHAQRFGLAQLHQLRGRVGRGANASFCILLGDPPGDVAKQRLETMVGTDDGFLIAEKDLELRGPGEFLGVRQSGLPEFTVGDLARDLNIMQVARDEAEKLLQENEFWLLPVYEGLRKHLFEADSAGLKY